MIHRDADDGQAERDIDTRGRIHLSRFLVPIEGTDLQGNMALIVIHGHASVELAAFGFSENAVRGYWTFNIETTLAQFLNGRDNLLSLLIAEHAVLAAVGIQTSHANMGLLNTKLLAGPNREAITLNSKLLILNSVIDIR